LVSAELLQQQQQQREMTPQAVGRCAGPTASVWGSAVVHNTAECRGSAYRTVHRRPSDKGFEPLPDKTQRGVAERKRPNQVHGSRTFWPNTANDKVRH